MTTGEADRHTDGSVVEGLNKVIECFDFSHHLEHVLSRHRALLACLLLACWERRVRDRTGTAVPVPIIVTSTPVKETNVDAYGT